jgi:hypothetical protein
LCQIRYIRHQIPALSTCLAQIGGCLPLLAYNTPFSTTPVQFGAKKESSDVYMDVVCQFMRYITLQTADAGLLESLRRGRLRTITTGH